MPVAVASDKTVFAKLSSSTTRIGSNKNEDLDQKILYEDLKNGTGTFTWPSQATYTGQFCNGQRNGKGVQTWRDKSSYEGEFVNDMRHGIGIHRFSSGEVYEGQFYKDHRHGKGVYTWPDGTKFLGMFYLDRKEGYGKFCFANGGKFEGLYKMDERFGPGIFTYKDSSKGQDIGIWHRHKLLKLCIPASNVFTMKNHSEYEYYPEEHRSKLNLSCDYDSEFHKIFVRESSSYTFLSKEFKTSLFAENTALPLGIESYSSNFEYLPLTYKHKEEFDKSFFGCNYKKMTSVANLDVTALNNTPLLMEVEKHVLKHQYGAVPFDAKAIMRAERSGFKSHAGHLEAMSQSLIDVAAEGDERAVYSILKTGLISPNVSDNKGNVALIGAAINCHRNIVNLLLDMGANVNQLTDEGVTALTACHVFYYPVDHFKENGAEDTINELRALSSKKFRKNGGSSKSSSRTNLPSVSNSSTTNNTEKRSNIAIQKLVSNNQAGGENVKNQNLEICKSDLKIMKARRDKILEAEVDSLNFLPDAKGNSSELSAQQLPSEKPTFSSNRNMLNYSVDVSDELIYKTANFLSFNKRVVEGVSAKNDQILELGTPSALAVWKAEHTQLRSMIKQLLQRGANPNIGTVPYPALFFAVKAGDIEAVELLLDEGALTDHRLSEKFLGYGMLHFATGLRSPECVRITECLLKANADPNITAMDEKMSFEPTKIRRLTSDDQQSLMDAYTVVSSSASGAVPAGVTEEAGRTPLHLACSRDDDYESCRDIAHLLLHHGANPDVNWSGHSPLTLAIASGNNLCIDELLAGGANASLHLTRHIPTALCAAFNMKYEHRRTLDGRLKLINKLVAHGANVLAPVQFGAKRLTGTVVDYAHWMFMSDKRIAHTPYHALTPDERDIYTTRRTLFSHIGDLLRESATKAECKRLLEIFKDGAKTVHVLLKVLHGIKKEQREMKKQNEKSANGVISALDEETDLKATDFQALKRGNLKQLPIWKPLIRYCYDCGRSVGVRLTPCSRCHEVYYCSRACKLKAWEERHKDECLRIKVRTQSPVPSPSEVAAIFTDHKLDETMERARIKTDTIVGALLDRQLFVAEEKQLAAKRLAAQGGTRQASRATTARSSSIRYRNNSAATSRRAPSSKKSAKSSCSTRSGFKGKQNPAKVSRRTRARVGKDVVFGTTGMTLAELGITENYSFE